MYCFMLFSSQDVGVLLGVGASTVREWGGKTSISCDNFFFLKKKSQINWSFCAGIFERTGAVRKETPININKKRWPVEVYSHIEKYIENHPCFYLEELQDELRDTFPALSNTSVPTICRALRHDMKLTRKVLERRAREIKPMEIADYKYRLNPLYLYPEQLVFVDETSKDGRTAYRKYARSPIGKPAYVNLSFGRGKRVSVLSAFNSTGFLAWGQTPNTFTRQIFHDTFAEHILPHLNTWPLPNSIVIIDNAKIHMYKEFFEMVATRGAVVVFLPPFCPHFNTIEQGFSVLKKWIQKYAHLVFARYPEMALDLAFRVCVSDSQSPVSMIKNCGYEKNGLCESHFPDVEE